MKTSSSEELLTHVHVVHSLADPGVVRCVRSNYPEKKEEKKAARPSYSRVRHAGNVGGASQLVPSSAQENVRARA